MINRFFKSRIITSKQSLSFFNRYQINQCLNNIDSSPLEKPWIIILQLSQNALGSWFSDFLLSPSYLWAVSVLKEEDSRPIEDNKWQEIWEFEPDTRPNHRGRTLHLLAPWSIQPNDRNMAFSIITPGKYLLYNAAAAELGPVKRRGFVPEIAKSVSVNWVFSFRLLIEAREENKDLKYLLA